MDPVSEPVFLLPLKKEASIFHTLLRRTALACAVSLTIALLWVSFIPAAGKSIGADYHVGAHLGSFLLLGLVWRLALPQVSPLVIGSCVIGFGLMQEAIEIFGHGHGFEVRDVFIDSLGAAIGVVLGNMAKFCFRATSGQ